MVIKVLDLNSLQTWKNLKTLSYFALTTPNFTKISRTGNVKFKDSKKGRNIKIFLSFLNRGLLHDMEMGRFPLCQTEMIQRQRLHWVTGPF